MAGLYLHIPFCESRCYYCDFYSSTFKGNRDLLLSSIQKELRERRQYITGSVRTIYFGGGTPSQLTTEEISSLLQTIFDNYDCRVEELTLEANPEDLAADYLQALKSLGVNRLSIGVQSFDDEDLKRINRRHTAQKAIEAVQLAQQIGFDNISIDLIYGLPQQTLMGWKKNIQQAIDLNVQHISAYSLTFEEGTMLTKMRDRGEIMEADEELSFEMFKLLRQTLSENGYVPYEISNFALPGYESKHNSSYWNYVPYLGVGPSAHSFDGQSRRWNIANSRLYISKMADGDTYYNMEMLDNFTRYNEYVMTGLRKKEGVDIAVLENLFGKDLRDYFLRMIDAYIKEEKVIKEGQHYYFSEDGIFISDYIIEELFWME
ncbi:MAG: radical SAM family heme chaperone HemW [Paludibacteraceae bacterium]|nr:radical SAM family heme chaperone HemW [Paludibacteraceae bacterium]